jgi:hypothetical protein
MQPPDGRGERLGAREQPHRRHERRTPRDRIEPDDGGLAVAESLECVLEVDGLLARADDQHTVREAVGSGEHALAQQHEPRECEHRGIDEDLLHPGAPGDHEQRDVRRSRAER